MSRKYPIAILLPHASLDAPPELTGRLAIDEHHIFNEADVYTDLIFDFRDHVTHWLRFPYARALIDVNRPDDPMQVARRGDGVVKTRTSYNHTVYQPGQQPDVRETRALVQRYWQPWHEQLAAIAADPAIKLVIDAHSMAARGPRHYDPLQQVRPRACVSNLGDASGRSHGAGGVTMDAAPLRLLGAEIGQRFAQLDTLCEVTDPGPVVLNTPYRGGWDLRGHGLKSRQPWAMIEVSRAMYIGPQQAQTPVTAPNMTKIEQLRGALWDAIMVLFRQITR